MGTVEVVMLVQGALTSFKKWLAAPVSRTELELLGGAEIVQEELKETSLLILSLV